MYIYCRSMIVSDQDSEHLDQITFSSLFFYPEAKVFKEIKSAESSDRIIREVR